MKRHIKTLKSWDEANYVCPKDDKWAYRLHNSIPWAPDNVKPLIPCRRNSAVSYSLPEDDLSPVFWIHDETDNGDYYAVSFEMPFNHIPVKSGNDLDEIVRYALEEFYRIIGFEI